MPGVPRGAVWAHRGRKLHRHVSQGEVQQPRCIQVHHLSRGQAPLAVRGSRYRLSELCQQRRFKGWVSFMGVAARAHCAIVTPPFGLSLRPTSPTSHSCTAAPSPVSTEEAAAYSVIGLTIALPIVAIVVVIVGTVLTLTYRKQTFDPQVHRGWVLHRRRPTPQVRVNAHEQCNPDGEVSVEGVVWESTSYHAGAVFRR